MTYLVDEDLVRALKTRAVREGKPDYKVLDEALRAHLDEFSVLDRIWDRAAETPLTEDEAMAIALETQREVRAELRREREGHEPPAASAR